MILLCALLCKQIHSRIQWSLINNDWICKNEKSLSWNCAFPMMLSNMHEWKYCSKNVVGAELKLLGKREKSTRILTHGDYRRIKSVPFPQLYHVIAAPLAPPASFRFRSGVHESPLSVLRRPLSSSFPVPASRQNGCNNPEEEEEEIRYIKFKTSFINFKI